MAVKYKTKICPTCKQEKPYSAYNKCGRTTSGIYYKCKECKKIEDKLYRRSVNGVIAKMYSHQKEKSIRRGHVQPDYTKQELINWLLWKTEFSKLFSQWVESGYAQSLIPSCDRLDDYKPYTLDNMRVVTWDVNNKKGHESIKNGTNKNQLKPVNQYSLNGEFISRHFSMHEAQRMTGVSQGSISSCCCNPGKYKTAGGFKWAFAEKDE